jgi:hypothetical protein
MMFNNGLPDSSLFYYISLLCLPHCLSAHMIFIFCSSTFYALCTMSIHYTVPLLFNSAAALSSFFTHESPSPTTPTTNSNSNNNTISSLYRVFIAFVHLLHAMFAMPLHANSAPISSNSRVLCLIIMVTLLLLWWFSHAFNITVCCTEILQPLWQFETLRLLCDSRAHLLFFSYRLQRSSICQSLLRIVFLHWTKLGESSSPLAITLKSLRILW